MNQTKVNCNCPHCEQIDQVQKISAIYTAGLSNSNFSGFVNGESVNLKRQNQSELSKRFKPPVKPIEPIKIPFTSDQVVYYSRKTIIICASLALFFLIINSFLFMFALAFLIYASIAFAIASSIRSNPNRHVVVKPTYQERLSHWQELCIIWNGTYYCHRCDIVYNPDKPDQVYHPENAGQLYNFEIGS